MPFVSVVVGKRIWVYLVSLFEGLGRLSKKVHCRNSQGSILMAEATFPGTALVSFWEIKVPFAFSLSKGFDCGAWAVQQQAALWGLAMDQHLYVKCRWVQIRNQANLLNRVRLKQQSTLPRGASLSLKNSELWLMTFLQVLLSITSSWAQHKNNSEGGENVEASFGLKVSERLQRTRQTKLALCYWDYRRR